jgi:hypothetical protein
MIYIIESAKILILLRRINFVQTMTYIRKRSNQSSKLNKISIVPHFFFLKKSCQIPPKQVVLQTGTVKI